MPENSSCKDCRAHSGVKADIEHVHEMATTNKREINEMKRYLLGIVSLAALNLLGMILLLALKAHGG